MIFLICINEQKKKYKYLVSMQSKLYAMSMQSRISKVSMHVVHEFCVVSFLSVLIISTK